MKRIVCLYLALVFVFSALLPVVAEELTLPSEAPAAEEETQSSEQNISDSKESSAASTEDVGYVDPYADISDYDLFYMGVFRMHPYMSYREFIENMMILDDAKSSKTNKFRLLADQIEALYYYGIDERELMRRLSFEIDYVDFSNIDALYSAMFNVLDEFSYYIPAETSSLFWDPDIYQGVGIVVSYESDKTPAGAYVKEVYYDSPAYNAGIQPSDRLAVVDGISLDALILNGINDALRSNISDGVVQLTVERDGALLDFELVPSDIVVPEYSLTFYPETKTAYLAVYSFSQENTVVDLRLDLYDTKANGYENIIIDLRDNSGGSLQYAMQIAGLFLTSKQQLFTMYGSDGLPYIGYFSNGLGYQFEKLYILTNEKTASAAEAMTMVLDELGGAVTIGKTTYGKAVGQYVVQLYDMSTIAVTTMLGKGPSDTTYNGQGLVPHIEVENEITPYEFPNDLQVLDETNFALATDGAENEAVLALERRLEIIGYLSPDRVDGVYDESITESVKIIQTVLGLEPTGIMDITVVNTINTAVEQYKNISYITDRQFETAYGLITGEITQEITQE